MRMIAVFVLGLLSVASVASAQLANVHSVYLLPMSGSLDQYLAHRITSAGVFEVVTDPAKADAVLTDRLGEDFERRIAELYPEPAAPKPEPPAKVETAKDETQPEAKPKAEESKDESSTAATIKESPVVHFGGVKRGRGMVFLVDGRNRKVLWSAYEEPKRSAPADMEHTAGRIVDQLKQALKKK